MLLFLKCLFLLVAENQCKMNETVYEVAVTGNTGCYAHCGLFRQMKHFFGKTGLIQLIPFLPGFCASDH